MGLPPCYFCKLFILAIQYYIWPQILPPWKWPWYPLWNGHRTVLKVAMSPKHCTGTLKVLWHVCKTSFLSWVFTLIHISPKTLLHNFLYNLLYNLSSKSGPWHTGSFSALTSAKIRRSFWSRLAFGDGLDYLRFEYEVIWAMAFWEKSKKPPKMGFLGPFQAQMLKSQVIWESFIIKQPPKIIFWDILHHKKPTGAH